MKQWLKIPREQRRELRQAYKQAGYSYMEAVKDFETELPKFETGGKTLPTATVSANSRFVTSADDPRYKAYKDSLNWYNEDKEYYNGYRDDIKDPSIRNIVPRYEDIPKTKEGYLIDDLYFGRVIHDNGVQRFYIEDEKAQYGKESAGISSSFSPKPKNKYIIRPMANPMQSLAAPNLSRDNSNDRSLIDIQSYFIDPWDSRYGEVPQNEIDVMKSQHRDKIQLRRTTDMHGNVNNVWPSEYSDELRNDLIPYGHPDRKGYNSGSEYMDAIKKRRFRAPLKRPTQNTNQ